MNNYCHSCKQADGYAYPRFKNSASISYPDHLLSCPACGRSIVLVDIETAAAVMGKSRKTIYAWIRQGKVKTARTASGGYLIWFSTLFDPQFENELAAKLM